MIGRLNASPAEALRDTYHGLREKAKSLPPDLADRLDCPFLICPKEGWADAMLRVLIVGQEPYDWGFDEKNTGSVWWGPPIWSLQEFINGESQELSNSLMEGPVERLMHAYYRHTYFLKSCSHSPFTRAFKYFQQFDKPNVTIEVAYTNLFRCALESDGPVNKRSPLYYAGKDHLERIYEWQEGVLTREIEILQPNCVIFFSGPHYDSVISREFPGLAFEPVGSHLPRQMATVVHPHLPARAFRTYHPGYLARGKWSWLSELRGLIESRDAVEI